MDNFFFQTNFALPIPLHGTPSFEDDNCTLSWMLRFEFVISASASEPISMQPLLDETSTEGILFYQFNENKIFEK